MHLQLSQHRRPIGTLAARVHAVRFVNPQMRLQVRTLVARIIAKTARKRFVTRMRHNMRLNITRVLRRIRARKTHELLFIRSQHVRTVSAMFDDFRHVGRDRLRAVDAVVDLGREIALQSNWKQKREQREEGERGEGVSNENGGI